MILRLLERIRVGEINLDSSFIVESEYAISPFGARGERVGELTGLVKERVQPNPDLTRRAKSLGVVGLKARGASHLATAEHARVNYLVTCDDKLIKRARPFGSLARGISLLELLKEREV